MLHAGRRTGASVAAEGGAAGAVSAAMRSESAFAGAPSRGAAQAGGGAHRLEAPVFRRERRVSGELALELERAHRVEFAVESSAQPEHAVVGIVGHGSGSKVFASAPRARERRDITVPIGAPVASAMSR